MGLAVTLVDNSAPSGLPISSTNPLPMSSAAYPSGATPLSAGSGNVANASAAVGALVLNSPLLVNFPYPIPASATNTNIVVTCPALGVGNTNNTVNAQGFYL